MWSVPQPPPLPTGDSQGDADRCRCHVPPCVLFTLAVAGAMLAAHHLRAEMSPPDVCTRIESESAAGKRLSVAVALERLPALPARLTSLQKRRRQASAQWCRRRGEHNAMSVCDQHVRGRGRRRLADWTSYAIARPRHRPWLGDAAELSQAREAVLVVRCKVNASLSSMRGVCPACKEPPAFNASMLQALAKAEALLGQPELIFEQRPRRRRPRHHRGEAGRHRNVSTPSSDASGGDTLYPPGSTSSRKASS